MADWESQRIDRTSMADLMQMIAQMQSMGEKSQDRKDRKEARVVADLNNILKLSSGALTPEQLQNAQKALFNVSEADISDTTKIASQVTQAALDNRQFEMNQYASRIDQASSIFSDPNYLDTADEWRDLETLRKSHTKDDGTYKYESTAVMLGDLYSQANTIYEGIESGSVKGFKTDLNIDFFDDEVKTKIKTYKDRLEKAIAADVGDGIITVEEARMIMGGRTKAEMGKEFNERATNTARHIQKQEALLEVYESNDPLKNMQTLFQLKGEDGESLMDEDSVPNDLVNQLMLGQQVPQETIDDLKRELGISYGRYERLKGSSYQGVTDTPPTDVSEFTKAASEDEIGETVLVPAIDEVTEVSEEELKKLDTEEDLSEGETKEDLPEGETEKEFIFGENTLPVEGGKFNESFEKISTYGIDDIEKLLVKNLPDTAFQNPYNPKLRIKSKYPHYIQKDLTKLKQIIQRYKDGTGNIGGSARIQAVKLYNKIIKSVNSFKTK